MSRRYDVKKADKTMKLKQYVFDKYFLYNHLRRDYFLSNRVQEIFGIKERPQYFCKRVNFLSCVKFIYLLVGELVHLVIRNGMFDHFFSKCNLKMCNYPKFWQLTNVKIQAMD